MKAIFVKNQDAAQVILDDLGGFSPKYDGKSTFENGPGFYIIRDGNEDGTPSRDLVDHTDEGTFGWCTLSEEEENKLML